MGDVRKEIHATVIPLKIASNARAAEILYSGDVQ